MKKNELIALARARFMVFKDCLRLIGESEEVIREFSGLIENLKLECTISQLKQVDSDLRSVMREFSAVCESRDVKIRLKNAIALKGIEGAMDILVDNVIKRGYIRDDDEFSEVSSWVDCIVQDSDLTSDSESRIHQVNDLLESYETDGRS